MDLCVCVCSIMSESCNPSLDYSPPGSSVHGIFQTILLEWIAISYSWMSSVQSLIHVHVFATPWSAVCLASLFFINSWSLFKLMSIESVMSSNHLVLCHPLLLPPSIIPSIGVFSSESTLRIRWPKYWSFSFHNGPSNEYSGLISPSTD